MNHLVIFGGLLVVSTVATLSAQALESEPEADLAKQLVNPVARLISVPFQGNMEFGIGPNDASRFTLNIQPVLPLTLNDHWNLIIRTILQDRWPAPASLRWWTLLPGNSEGEGGVGSALRHHHALPEMKNRLSIVHTQIKPKPVASSIK